MSARRRARAEATVDFVAGTTVPPVLAAARSRNRAWESPRTMAFTMVLVPLILRSAASSESSLVRSPPSVMTMAYVRSVEATEARASRSDVPPEGTRSFVDNGRPNAIGLALAT